MPNIIIITGKSKKICGGNCPNLNTIGNTSVCKIGNVILKKRGLMSYERSHFCFNMTKHNTTLIPDEDLEEYAKENNIVLRGREPEEITVEDPRPAGETPCECSEDCENTEEGIKIEIER